MDLFCLELIYNGLFVLISSHLNFLCPSRSCTWKHFVIDNYWLSVTITGIPFHSIFIGNILLYSECCTMEWNVLYECQVDYLCMSSLDVNLKLDTIEKEIYMLKKFFLNPLNENRVKSWTCLLRLLLCYIIKVIVH